MKTKCYLPSLLNANLQRLVERIHFAYACLDLLIASFTYDRQKTNRNAAFQANGLKIAT